MFVAGLLLILGAAGQAAITWAQRVGWWGFAAILLGPASVSLLFGWRVDINEFSLHAFYRDRLARCYLGASNRKRRPNMFTGFDAERREPGGRRLETEPRLRRAVPRLLYRDESDRGRGARVAGAQGRVVLVRLRVFRATTCRGRTQSSRKLRYSGYADTATFAYPSGPSVATAAAISGAAVSPNMGYHTNPATGFLLTLFNVRLGWWLRNPRTVRQDGEAIPDGGRVSPSPQCALLQLQRELFGYINDTSNYVYLTDGGHFDNMGLYELVRRGCRYIVICDAEQDGDLKFDGIASAIRKCRIDFGVDVSIDLRMLQPVAAGAPYLHRHAVVGTITYPGHGPDCEGKVVYIKSSMTGDEAADVMSHQREARRVPRRFDSGPMVQRVAVRELSEARLPHRARRVRTGVGSDGPGRAVRRQRLLRDPVRHLVPSDAGDGEISGGAHGPLRRARTRIADRAAARRTPRAADPSHGAEPRTG